MSKDFSEDVAFLVGKDEGETIAKDGPAPLDIAAAVSLKDVFNFFSLAFRYPRETVHEELGRVTPQFDDFLNAFAGNVPELPGAVDLQAEYARLFVNGRDGVPAIPCASCHLNGRVTKGESYDRLCRIMEKTGFVPDEPAGELEDHLAVLLEFCKMLTERLIEASASGGVLLNEMMNFFGVIIVRYLRPLAKKILAGVSKSAVMDFYAVSARALYNFLVDVQKIYAHVFGVPVVAARKRGMWCSSTASNA